MNPSMLIIFIFAVSPSGTAHLPTSSYVWLKVVIYPVPIERSERLEPIVMGAPSLGQVHFCSALEFFAIQVERLFDLTYQWGQSSYKRKAFPLCFHQVFSQASLGQL